MFKVTFKFETENDVEIFANAGENLLDIAKKANVAIDAPCSGNGSCGKCRVRLLSGEADTVATRHIGEDELSEGWRLACASKVKGDLTLFVPDIASAYKSRMKVADLSSKEEQELFQRIKAGILEGGIEFGHGFKVLECRLEEPTLSDTMADLERLERKLGELTGKKNIVFTHQAVLDLPDALREDGFSVRCVINETESVKVFRVRPASVGAHPYGLAIDIGTTTVSGIIVNMDTLEIIAKGSSGNGQIRYGADVINRIMESQKPGGRERLQKAVIEETINPLIKEMCRAAGIEKSDICAAVIAANTTMEHLLIGANANHLRQEPYIPAFFSLKGVTCGDVGIHANKSAEIILAPNIGSYVGGDITAGAFTTMQWKQPELSLFIDLGTNGELVFGSGDFLLSCACSAGPAFEGGDISCGMRATDGAIEACRIDGETMEPELTVVGGVQPVGVCGSGIIDIISELYVTGIINSKGQFIREGSRVTRDEHGIGSYIIAFRQGNMSRNIEINEVDIDNFIRAKGAIFSAVATMLGSMDMDVSVLERVYVAGGIGSGINMRNAINIGMFPDIPAGKYVYVGNSSLNGAYAMLTSDKAKSKVFEIANAMTYIELSSDPSYMDRFVAACFLPHTDERLFPSVEKRYKNGG